MSGHYEPQRERERRFLVGETSVTEGASWEFVTQGYFFAEDGYAIRIRTIEHPSGKRGALEFVRAALTAKGPRIGDERDEYETDMDPLLASEFIARCAHVIRKRRYHVLYANETWDIDEFFDNNAGLWIAELEGEDIRGAAMPSWAEREITLESRFNNDELAFHPVSAWTDSDWKPRSIWD
jgi:CYTH domain-containing protein